MAKIAFIEVTSTVSYGGVQTAVWQLAYALAQRGHAVSVIGGEGTIRPPEDKPAIEVLTFPFRSRDRFPSLGAQFRKLGERLSFLAQAKDAVFARNFDWIILTKPYDFFWAWRAPRNSTTRFAFMSGGTDFSWGDRYLARHIDAWLACSHFNAWQIAAHYKRFPQVIFNGVDTAQFTPHADGDDDLRPQLGFAPDTVVFGFAGRLVGWKGLEFAFRALAEPALQAYKVHLAIVGEGPAKPALQALAHELNIAQRVSFHGALPHAALPQFYRAIDVGVFPSIADEAFGITIAEAMSCGKPVIASHIGGIPEVVGNEGSCGLLAPPANASALAAAMQTLATSDTLRNSMGRAARKRVETLYTWEHSATRLLDALQQK